MPSAQGNLIKTHGHCPIEVLLLLERIGVRKDDGEDVVEIVRDAAGKLSDSLQLSLLPLIAPAIEDRRGGNLVLGGARA